jgi:hypothetical protein
MILQTGRLAANYLRAAQGKGSSRHNAKLDKCKKMITAYKSMALDYVNYSLVRTIERRIADFYYFLFRVLKEVADYLRRKIGKQVLNK